MILTQFYTRLNQFKVYSQIYRNPELLNRVNLNEFVAQPLFDFLVIIMIFVLPAITMRLISEEKKLKTDELLLTSPIGSFNIIIGKFLGSFFFLITMIGLSLLYIGILLFFGNPELGPIISGYIGLVLLGSVILAIGLFASSLTSNQITAYFISFAINLLLLFTGWAGQLTESNVGKLLTYLSIRDHFQNFIKGIIDTQDTFYFLTMIVGFIFLAKASFKGAN
jgi:ABC-2 type transport system permease protein